MNFTGGSRYDYSQNLCRPLYGGADPDRCHRVVSLLRGFGVVSYRLRGADPVGCGAVHRGAHIVPDIHLCEVASQTQPF